MKKIFSVLSIFFLAIFLVSCDNEVSKNRYIVNFDTNGGEPNISSQTLEEGDLVIKPEDIKKGDLILEYWYDSSTNNEWVFETDKVVNDLTLVAKWQEDTNSNEDYVKVTFDFGYDNKTEFQEVQKTSKLEKPVDPTREGYVFEGWYLNDKLYDFNSNLELDIRLVAKWTEIINNQDFIVTIDYGYDNKIETINVEYGKTLSKPNNPIREGYSFLGWFIGDSNYNFNSPVINNINIAAKWSMDDKLPEDAVEQVILNLGFEEEDGFVSRSIYNDSFLDGTDEKMFELFYGTASTTNAISGNSSLQFRYYDSSPNNKAFMQTLFSLSHVTKLEFMAKSNVVGTKLKVLYSTVDNKFDDVSNHGGLYELTNETVSYTSIIPKHFEGKKVYVRFELVANNETENKTNIIIDNLDFYGLASRPKDVNISFETNEGNLIEDIKVPYDTKIDLIPTPKKVGYKFVGWYLDQELINLFDSTMKITKDLKLYAKWEVEESFEGKLVYTNRYGVVPSGVSNYANSFRLEFKLLVLDEVVLLDETNFKEGTVTINGVTRELTFNSDTTIWISINQEDIAYYRFVDKDDYIYTASINLSDYINIGSKKFVDYKINDEANIYYNNYILYDNNGIDLSIDKDSISEIFVGTNNEFSKENLFTNSNYYHLASLDDSAIKEIVIIKNDGSIYYVEIDHIKSYLVKFIINDEIREKLILENTLLEMPEYPVKENMEAYFTDSTGNEYDFSKAVNQNLELKLNYRKNNDNLLLEIDFNIEGFSANSSGGIPSDETKINDLYSTDRVIGALSLYGDEFDLSKYLRLGTSKNSGSITFDSNNIKKVLILARNYKNDQGSITINEEEINLTNELVEYEVLTYGNIFEIISSKRIWIQSIKFIG